jgi:hypothetical protein
MNLISEYAGSEGSMEGEKKKKGRSSKRSEIINRNEKVF